MASTYVAAGDREYGRYCNPTWAAFEQVMGTLEGGRAISFASGMAAVTTVLDLVGHGGGVVAARHSYSGTVIRSPTSRLGRACKVGCSTSPTPRPSSPR